MIMLLPSTPIAVKIFPLYLPVRNVPATQIMGRQCLKASMHIANEKMLYAGPLDLGNLDAPSAGCQCVSLDSSPAMSLGGGQHHYRRHRMTQISPPEPSP